MGYIGRLLRFRWGQFLGVRPSGFTLLAMLLLSGVHRTEYVSGDLFTRVNKRDYMCYDLPSLGESIQSRFILKAA